MSDERPKEKQRPEIPVLETERLRLRALTMDDLDGFYAFVKETDVTDYMGRPPYESIDAARARIKERLEKRFGYGPDRFTWAVEEKATGRYVGEAGLHSVDKKNRRGELARGLVAEARGKGYGAEAGRAVLDFAFDVLGLNRVQAVTRTTNEASQRSLAGLGFSKEGTLRDYWTIDGKPATTCIYSLLREEYRTEKAA
ncbi:MAG TPA: GNAT family protein [Patescibacteria group bacterium]